MKLFLFTVLFVLSCASVAAYNNDLCKGKLSSLYYFVGDSMNPTMYSGDFVQYKQLSTNQALLLREGDIVVLSYFGKGFVMNDYYLGNKATWLVHRIVATGKSGVFYTKGDNNPIDDGILWNPYDVVGIVCRVNGVRI